MGLDWGWGTQRRTVIPQSHGKLFSQCACACLLQTNSLYPRDTRMLMITMFNTHLGISSNGIESIIKGKEEIKSLFAEDIIIS